MEYKTGKTSNAVKFPKPLLLATEKGYNALSGVMAQPINKWADFKKVLKQLKDPRAHELYETIILDTADILFDLCEKYICQREGVDKIGDIPYGAGYGMLEKEYDEALREIPLMDYGLVMISHSEDKEFKDENGESYNKIVPTLPKRPRKIVLRMADIIGYSKIVETEEGNKTYLYMRGTPRFEAGSRWKYTPDVIEFNYTNLTNAIADAIEKAEKEEGAEVVDEHINVYKPVEEEMPFDELIKETTSVIQKLMEKDEEGNAPKITKIIESHLGKGRKFKDVTEEQADMVSLILDDLKDLLKIEQ
ncbi:ATP-binding protein [Bacillus smithii]|uniref:ATP-binding protein n=1 Tax=Bacillus smithii TaxID=1479 RepID=UPI002E22EFFF|nr:ATP-binding protein [Bacillus smithii]MED4929191.1 ATP-binding protein [Bacillus smithii]